MDEPTNDPSAAFGVYRSDVDDVNVLRLRGRIVTAGGVAAWSDPRAMVGAAPIDTQACYESVRDVLRLRNATWSSSAQAAGAPAGTQVIIDASAMATAAPTSVSRSDELGLSDFASIDADAAFKLGLGALQHAMRRLELLEAVWGYRYGGTTGPYRGPFQDVQRLVGSTQRQGDMAPSSMALSADARTLVLNNLSAEVDGVVAGAAYVFRRDAISGIWSELCVLAPDAPQANGQFGQSIAVANDVVVATAAGNVIIDHVVAVGEVFRSNADGSEGAVYVYNVSGKTPTLVQTLLPPATGTERFGANMAIASDDAKTLVIAALNGVHVYRMADGEGGAYALQATLTSPALASEAGTYGLGGSTVAVAADGSLIAFTCDSHVIYVFELLEGAWTAVQVIADADATLVAVRLTPSGSHLATGNQVYLRGGGPGTEFALLQRLPQYATHDIGITENGATIAVARLDRVHIYQALDGMAYVEKEIVAQDGGYIVISRDGRLLIVGNRNDILNSTDTEPTGSAHVFTS